jgi:SWI/SNF-related matrix-associated actin-dependent regulator 1 of chromatin subfamily A
MRITKKCPICGKISEIKREFKLAGLTVTNYECGHTDARADATGTIAAVTSSDGRKPYQYQITGAQWLVQNNMRALLADEMGIGKTIQALLAANSSKDTPVLYVCKAGLRMQAMREAMRWCGWLFQIINYEDEFVLPGLPGYILGYDSLAYTSFKTKSGKTVTKGFKDIAGFVEKLAPKLIILDECQHIKNKESKRTRAIQDLTRTAYHVIALSGTPIYNNMKEYFPILNILHPEKFPSEAGYIMRWGKQVWTGKTWKIGGIKDIPAWKDYTKDFILRRTRAEVLPDLPTVDRRYQFEDLGGSVADAYKAELQKFKDYTLFNSGNDNALQKRAQTMAMMARMRHLTGIAKIPGVVEFVSDFIRDTDRKIVIFTHHKDVAAEVIRRLRQELPEETVLNLDAPISQSTVDEFWGKPRIMVASTIAAGEGLNLQCCSDCIMMEQQWTPFREEQAEGRFPRPGQTADKISATYFIAVGTIDEFLAELKEKKRSMFASAVEYKETQWNESDIMQELAEILIQKGSRWEI